MEKTLKNLAGDKVITLRLKKAGKGQTFRFKPELCPHWDSLHAITYVGETPYKSVSYYVPLTIQLFWIGLIFSVEIHKRKLGEGKMVRYQDSQFAAIDDALNKSKS